jgi:hypothetical protein
MCTFVISFESLSSRSLSLILREALKLNRCIKLRVIFTGSNSNYLTDLPQYVEVLIQTSNYEKAEIVFCIISLSNIKIT